ncbi:MAG: thermonuclease family protein [Chloroflexi bacterium]|nr:thermonuclease family protein [Chloroflexota bacterium]
MNVFSSIIGLAVLTAGAYGLSAANTRVPSTARDVKRGAGLVIMVLLFLLTLAGCIGKQKTASTASQILAGKHDGIEAIPAKVTQVIEWNVADMMIDGKSEEVGLIGVDMPETKSKANDSVPIVKDAFAYTMRKLAGKTVYLEFDESLKGENGRLLAYVWLEPPSSSSKDEARAKMLNAQLLVEGYGVAVTTQPNTKYADMFVSFGLESQQAGKGRWASNQKDCAYKRLRAKLRAKRVQASGGMSIDVGPK